MEKISKYISVFLCVAVFFTSIVINGAGSITASAEATITGKVNVTDALRVRLEPSTSSQLIGTLSPGAAVNIHEEVNGWYKIDYNNSFGYVSKDYIIDIKEIPKYEHNEEFEALLTKQNFPESYKVKLRQLHAAHPNWVFVADHLNMTFKDAVAAESKVGKSLVQNSTAKASWKSMMQYAYDWDKKEYVSYDTGGWVTAEREVVEYYMEPRNFLDENGIYMFLDQSYNEQLQTKEGLQNIIKGTFLEQPFPEETHASYADVIMEAAKKSGVSPYVLAAMILIEQGSGGTGASISGTEAGYEGYYNYFNIRAYQSGQYSAVAYGLLFAKETNTNPDKNYDRPWNTRAKSIIGGAKYYYSGYLKRGQDNLYYKKFNVITPTYYLNQYMTNVQGAYGEAMKLKNGYSVVSQDATLTFSIPVYKETSEENKTALPISEGANNYYLTSLKLNGQELEGFSRYKNTYEITLENTSSLINIEATALDGAKVYGVGPVTLKEGANTVSITVTALSGKNSWYTLFIYLKGAQEPNSEPTIEGKYNMSSYVSGVEIGTDVATFISNFNVKNGTAKVFDINGKEKSSGVIATGDYVSVFNNSGAKKADYSIVIFGDTNSDGKISIVDLARVQKHLLELSKLAGSQNSAADVNHDGKISILDLARVQKHLLELTKIQQ